MGSNQDVEINLGAGRLLGLFFGLVVLCAIFFGLGYSLGRNSSSPAMMASSEVAGAGASANVSKPHTSPGSAAAPAAPSKSGAADDLTFYKAVEQKDASAQLTPAAPPDNSAAKPAPEAARPFAGYIVQIAAVTRQEDAQVLLGALRKKNYPVFVINNSPGDKLYHVQVGPYADIADAETMRSRLAADGYNPILKK